MRTGARTLCMPTLSEIQAKLPQLLNRVRAAETRLANPPAKANKNTAAGALATELGGAVSDALFGTPEIGRLVLREAATEQAHERRRRFDDDGRQEGSRILAAA